MSYWIIENGVLCHHGVKGQKWGVRRYQNADGTPKTNARGSQSHEDRLKKSSTWKKVAKYAAIGIGVTAVAAVGAYFVAKALRSSGNGHRTAKANQVMSSVVRRDQAGLHPGPGRATWRPMGQNRGSMITAPSKKPLPGWGSVQIGTPYDHKGTWYTGFSMDKVVPIQRRKILS